MYVNLYEYLCEHPLIRRFVFLLYVVVHFDYLAVIEIFSLFLRRTCTSTFSSHQLTVWPESLGPKTPKGNLKTPKKTPL